MKQSGISGALGIKMANPNKEVITFVGDGSYLLYNSDIYSSVITNNKLIVIVCDNGGHAVKVEKNSIVCLRVQMYQI